MRSPAFDASLRIHRGIKTYQASDRFLRLAGFVTAPHSFLDRFFKISLIFSIR